MSFLQNIWEKYHTVGAISPSSRFLCEKIIRPIDFSKRSHIVEFGPGNGVFTDEILKKMTPDSRLTIFEKEPSCIAILEKKYENDPRVTLHPHGAENVTHHISGSSVDAVVSGLPLAFIDDTTVNTILTSAYSIMKPRATFTQFQYFMTNRKHIHSVFSEVSYEFTFLNLPPAFVYICKK